MHKITVLDISGSSQLVKVEYPTANGVRTGYISNTNNIVYTYQSLWKNGSTSETTYSENGSVLGCLDPYEQATPLHKKNGMLNVVYDTTKGKNTKSGFVKYFAGINI